jgi:hypothetical protein
MKLALQNVHEALKPQGKFALVVGRNRTRLSERDFVIETGTLISEVAETIGYRTVEITELDAYHRFSLHQKNSIRTEQLVILERA